MNEWSKFTESSSDLLWSSRHHHSIRPLLICCSTSCCAWLFSVVFRFDLSVLVYVLLLLLSDFSVTLSKNGTLNYQRQQPPTQSLSSETTKLVINYIQLYHQVYIVGVFRIYLFIKRCWCTSGQRFILLASTTIDIFCKLCARFDIYF